MIECVLAWILFFVGIFTSNPIYFVASACYAAASYLCRLHDERKRQ